MPSSTRPASSAGPGSPWVGRGTARGREGFLAVLGPSPVPALLLDADAGSLWVLVANQAARLLLASSSPDPLVGDGLTGALAPDDLLAVTGAAAEVLGGRVPAWQHEVVLAGTPVGLALSRLVTPGEPALLVVQLLDRTARDLTGLLPETARESPPADLLERIRRNGERILRLVEGSAIPAHAR